MAWILNLCAAPAQGAERIEWASELGANDFLSGDMVA
jgi:hypothetical protein